MTERFRVGIVGLNSEHNRQSKTARSNLIASICVPFAVLIVNPTTTTRLILTSTAQKQRLGGEMIGERKFDISCRIEHAGRHWACGARPHLPPPSALLRRLVGREPALAPDGFLARASEHAGLRPWLAPIKTTTNSLKLSAMVFRNNITMRGVLFQI